MAKLRPRPAQTPLGHPLQRLDYHEVGQTVGRVGVVGPPHQVEGVALDLGGRHVLVEGHGLAVGVEAHGQQQTLVPRVEDPTERHGVAPLGLALPGFGHELEQLVRELGRYVVRRVEALRRVQPAFLIRL